MRASAPETVITVRSFCFAPLNEATIASLLFSHALFGLTLGAIYRRPVGYGVKRKPLPPPLRRARSSERKLQRTPTGFMFATGIECSYPTIDHGRWRCDQMRFHRTLPNVAARPSLAREIGVTHIRYGPPLHLIFDGPDVTTGTISIRRWKSFWPGPEPIIDLCHFGVPSWLGTFQNREIGRALEEYAGAFAERYPWVRFYTPVNEMYVSARMSALDGLWNEQLQDEGAYVRAAWNLADASIRMSDAILAQPS